MNEPNEGYFPPEGPIEELAARDVAEGLGEMFEAGEFLVLRGGAFAAPVTNGSVDAVVWKYQTRATPALIGPIAPANDVTIDGTSYLVHDPEVPEPDETQVQVLRVIDWFSAYYQLGLIAASRVPGSPDTRADPRSMLSWLAPEPDEQAG